MQFLQRVVVAMMSEESQTPLSSCKGKSFIEKNPDLFMLNSDTELLPVLHSHEIKQTCIGCLPLQVLLITPSFTQSLF